MSQHCWHIPTNEDEIKEIFFEEVDELLEGVDDLLKIWRRQPSDKKTLTEIRRAFHTMKGSGRMANVLDVSELAWKVENMLNRALAGAVPVSEPMVLLVSKVRELMPKIVNAIKNGQSLARNEEIAKLMKFADTFATERRSTEIAAQLAETSTSAKPPSELYELNRKVDRCMQRADEALRRSELALHQARLNTEANAPASSAEPDGDGVRLRDRRFGWPALMLSALCGAAVAAGLLLSSSLIP